MSTDHQGAPLDPSGTPQERRTPAGASRVESHPPQRATDPTLIIGSDGSFTEPKRGASDHDRQFAQLVRQSSLASDTQVGDCMNALRTISELGAAKSLQDLMVERGVLTENQAKSLAYAVRKGEHGGILSGFQLLEKIGEGGMGEVYKATQTSLDRIVALKILPERLASNRDFVSRFEREARTAARLSHPNIVGAVDVGMAGGRYYFAMEYVNGQSVANIIEKEGKLSEDRALDIIIQSTRGLEYAWRNNMIHRDIKPDNLLLTTEGVVKIADLGLAREAGDVDVTRLTHAGATMGTPHYVSPEQGLGEEDLDIRTDIYALGVTFYQLVTGELPFKGRDAVAIIAARLQGQASRADDVNPSVSGEVAQIISVMMARERDDRYPDPQVLLHDLTLVAEGGEPEFASADYASKTKAVEAARLKATSTSVIIRRKPKKSKALVYAGLGGAIGLLVVIAAVLAFSLGSRAPEAQAEARSPVMSAEDEARRAKLAEAAAALHEAAKAKADAGDFAAALALLDESGERFAATEHARRLEAMRVEYTRRLEDERRRAAEAAERERRYGELLALGRSAKDVSDYSSAISLYIQAKAQKDTPEIDDFIAEARRLQLVARADEAESRGNLDVAIRAYRQALEMKNVPELERKAVEIERRIALADRLSVASRLRGEARWQEAALAYGQALELARGDERADIRKAAAEADAEVKYAEALDRARTAAARKDWEGSLAAAQEALSVKPAASEAVSLADKARDALGPEPRLVNSLGMTMLLVPEGEFAMGSDDGPANERPSRQVWLGSYYISQHEVTNAQFEEFRPGHRSRYRQFSPSDDTPVIAVTWEEAMAFCRWLSAREGALYRLPTEAEWEKAARGTDGRRFPWGDEPPIASGEYRCNFAPSRDRDSWRRDGFEMAAPVGMFPSGASPFGALDMAGNVWEWCMDWYSDDHYAHAPARDPRGPASGEHRVVRGGSFTNQMDALTTTRRLGIDPDFYEANLGFRVVRELGGRRNQ